MYKDKISAEMVAEYVSTMEDTLLAIGGFPEGDYKIEIKSIEKSENGYICKISGIC